MVGDQLNAISPSLSLTGKEVKEAAGVIQPSFTGYLVLFELLDVVHCVLVIILQLLELDFDGLDLFLFYLDSLLSHLELFGHFDLLRLQRPNDDH